MPSLRAAFQTRGGPRRGRRCTTGPHEKDPCSVWRSCTGRYDGGDPARPVCRDEPDLPATLLAQRVEERSQGLLVPPRLGPHQLAGVVVDDDHQVLVAFLVRDLVDPDADQLVEGSVAARHRPPPGHDRAHRPPRHSHQLFHGRLRTVRCQPSRHVVEPAGVARPVTGPRHDATTTPCSGSSPSGRRPPARSGPSPGPGPPAAPPLSAVVTGALALADPAPPRPLFGLGPKPLRLRRPRRALRFRPPSR